LVDDEKANEKTLLPYLTSEVVFNANDVFFKFFWEDASLDVTRV
jgi:hypothetical protein